MNLDLVVILQLMAVGIGAGYAAGLLGIGGGMVLVPFITAILQHQGLGLDMAVKMGIATGMATIAFTSISSVRAHNKHGAVRWDLVKTITPGILLGALFTSLGLFAVLKGHWLAILFGVFVIISATQMLLDRQPKATRTMPAVPGRVAAGGVIGAVSGLVGAGGGFISVPFLVWCNVPMHSAVATSAALGFPIALFNSIGYAYSGAGLAGRMDHSLGYIWLPGLLLIASCSVLTAPLGAKTAHALNPRPLKRVSALALYAAAIYMLYKVL